MRSFCGFDNTSFDQVIVVEVSGLMIRSYCSLDRISYDQVIVVEVALGRDRRETVSLEQHRSCSCQCKVKVVMMSDDTNDDASKQLCKRCQ